MSDIKTTIRVQALESLVAYLIECLSHNEKQELRRFISAVEDHMEAWPAFKSLSDEEQELFRKEVPEFMKRLVDRQPKTPLPLPATSPDYVSS